MNKINNFLHVELDYPFHKYSNPDLYQDFDVLIINTENEPFEIPSHELAVDKIRKETVLVQLGNKIKFIWITSKQDNSIQSNIIPSQDYTRLFINNTIKKELYISNEYLKECIVSGKLEFPFKIPTQTIVSSFINDIFKQYNIQVLLSSIEKLKAHHNYIWSDKELYNEIESISIKGGKITQDRKHEIHGYFMKTYYFEKDGLVNIETIAKKINIKSRVDKLQISNIENFKSIKVLSSNFDWYRPDLINFKSISSVPGYTYPKILSGNIDPAILRNVIIENYSHLMKIPFFVLKGDTDQSILKYLSSFPNLKSISYYGEIDKVLFFKSIPNKVINLSISGLKLKGLYLFTTLPILENQFKKLKISPSDIQFKLLKPHNYYKLKSLSICENNENNVSSERIWVKLKFPSAIKNSQTINCISNFGANHVKINLHESIDHIYIKYKHYTFDPNTLEFKKSDNIKTVTCFGKYLKKIHFLKLKEYFKNFTLLYVSNKTFEKCKQFLEPMALKEGFKISLI